ncbi:VOC family protein [Devosia sp. MC532]|uniref:VOC family protein n=1 Tax=Devosia sp. MC532 TaxID=2799788 RepID=UPI0018F2E3AB|nr:VOC family protein [Devosia sp. MC532]MBJ7578868.1 VOC family protein [Devosia sp. MC532]
MGVINQIVFDCEHPAALARFWANALDGYALREYDQLELVRLAVFGLTPETDPTVMVDGPGPSLCFQNVDGQRHDNNRVHLDVEVANRQAEVDRLKELGASIDRVLPTYTVMRDPEGNQLCLIDKRESIAA